MVIELSCHDAFTEQLEAMHLGLDAAALVIDAPAFPDCPAEAAACTKGFIAGFDARRAFGPGPCVAAGGDDGAGMACGDSVVAGFCVVGSIGADRSDRLICRVWGHHFIAERAWWMR